MFNFSAPTKAKQGGCDSIVTGSAAAAFPAAAAATPAAAIVNFGSIVPAQAPNAADADDDNNENDVKVQPTVDDPNWNDVQEFGKVRIFRLKDLENRATGWGVFGSGTLRLQTHKTDTKKAPRMVMRDEMGKVLVNMSIDPQAKFVLNNTAQASMGYIQFNGVNDADRGNEGFVLYATWELSQGLHAKLVELVPNAADADDDVVGDGR